ncbi:hypothetical protein [Microlunatus ginsengisoli]|uniref:Serine/threonine protein kinase n=1 Tax=Microlunatus ginsengisoli TaxID=363863 RepID=A0ABP6ZGN2_9ACTN
MSELTPRHSGSRWEPSRDPFTPGGSPGRSPDRAAAEPTVPIPAAAMSPAASSPDAVRTATDPDDRADRRGSALVVVSVVAVLTLLLTGGWLWLAPQLRHGDDPSTASSQAPSAGGPDGRTGPGFGHDRPHRDRDGDRGQRPRTFGDEQGSDGAGSGAGGSSGGA